MFFESRFDFWKSSLPWDEVSRLFHRGKNFAAYDAGKKLWASGVSCEGKDLFLWHDILRAVGQEDSFQHAPAAGENYDDMLFRAFSVSLKERLPEAIRHLDQAIEEQFKTEPVHRNIALSIRLTCFARMDRIGTTRDAIDELQQKPVFDNPLVKYNCAYAYYVLMQWNDALALFKGLCRQCPGWPRPHLYLMQCYLGVGRSEDAEQLARDLLLRFPEDITVFKTVTARLSVHDESYLIEGEIADRLEEWRKYAHQMKSLDALKARALVHAGRSHDALDFVDPEDVYLIARIKEVQPDQPIKKLDLDGLIQGRNHCVPCSVAILLNYLDYPVDSTDIAHQLSGEQGVASWRLDAWLMENKIDVVDIQCDIDVLKGMIDSGIPLLVTMTGYFSAHMAVLGGYDDSLKEFLIMDPAYGAMVSLPYECAASLGELQGAPMALFPAGKVEGKHPVSNDWIDQNATVCRRIRRAAHQMDAAKANEFLEELDATGLHRKLMAVEYPLSFTSPSAHNEILHQLAADDEAPLNVRFNCAVSLLEFDDTEKAVELYRGFREGLPRLSRSFWMVCWYRRKGHWNKVVSYLEVMLERSAHNDTFWYEYSEALRMISDDEEADEALRICMDINNKNLAANLNYFHLHNSKKEYRGNARRVKELLEQYPTNLNLRSLAAQYAFFLGASGEGEKILKESIALAPNSDLAYGTLRGWYARQDRTDLMDAVDRGNPMVSTMEEAEAHVPTADDLPSWFSLAEREAEQGKPGPALGFLTQKDDKSELKPLDHLSYRTLAINCLVQKMPRSSDVDALCMLLPESVPEPEMKSLCFFLGDINVFSLKPDEAAAVLQWMDQLKISDRSSSRAEFQRALLWEISGDKVVAKKKYQALVRSGFSEASFRLGLFAHEKHLYAEARRHFQTMLNEYPGDAAALWFKAQSESMLNMPQTAVKSLEVLVTLVPYDERVAQLLLKMHAALKSIGRGDRWLKENGERYTRHLAEWWKLWEQSSSENWTAVLNSMTAEYQEAHPEDADVFRFQALHALSRLTFPEVSAVVDKHPDVFYFTELKGEMLLDKDPKAAVKILLDMIKREPSARAFHLLLKACSVKETSDHLFTIFGKGDSNKEQASSAIQSLYTVLMDAGLHDDAKAFLLEVRARLPDQLDARMELIRIHLSCGELEAAQKDAALIYGQSKDNPEAIWLYAQSLDSDSPRRAAALYQDYFDLSKDASALTAMAALKHREGASKAAVSLYREALELDLMQPIAVMNLYILLGSTHNLFKPCCAILDGPIRPDLINFCVVAVFLGIEQREKLPLTWEAQASARLKAVVQSQTEVDQEEIHNLSLMLMVWATYRKSRTILQETIPDETYWRKTDRYARTHISWRDRSWVPRD